MASLKANLGFVPNTDQYEKKKKDLEQEYKDFIIYGKGEEFQQYSELEKYITSDEFALSRKRIMGQKFSETEEYKNEVEYKSLKKSKEIKDYFKIKDSDKLKYYEAFKESDLLKRYNDLKEFVASDEYKKVKNYMALPAQKRYEDTDEFKKESRYLDLKKTPEIISYLKSQKKKKSEESEGEENKELINEFKELQNHVKNPSFKSDKKKILKKKFKNTPEFEKGKELKSLEKNKEIKGFFAFGSSKLYENYKALHESEKIQHYEELEEIINSDEFKKVKDYMALSPRKKFEASEEFQKQKRYEELKKSGKIVWYKKLAKSDKFKCVDCWEETFFDDFSGSKLDDKKWMTRYFWGDYFLNEAFSLAEDKHFVTDGENIIIDNSVLSILTKKEKRKGMAWDNGKIVKNNTLNFPLGFFPKEFEYTSGLISTAETFRQQYGLFEAKVRFEGKNVTHAFWMLSDKMLPHIDVAKLDKKLQMNNFWGDSNKGKENRNVNKLFSSKYKNGYFIYSLEWTPEKMIWKINGVEVVSKTSGIPEEPMYILFSSGIYRDTNDNNLPAKMDIDWVRCFQKK